MSGQPAARTVHEVFESSARAYASLPLFGHKQGGAWVWQSYGEVAADVSKARRGLAKLGVGKGDRVAIISRNSVEWAVGAFATYGRSAAYVPMYTHQRERDWEYIVRDSEAKVLIVGTAELLPKVQRFLLEIPTLKHLVVVDDAVVPPGGTRVLRYSELLARGAEGDPSDAVLAPEPGDIAGFIYTSGTTGLPKGVLLSHDNIAHIVRGIDPLGFDFGPKDRSLSFLPWAHVFGQVCDLHILLSCGASIALAESPDKLVENMAEVRPTILCAVPRVFNQLHKFVQMQLSGPSATTRRIAEEARRVAAELSEGKSLSPRRAFYLGMGRLQALFRPSASDGPGAMQRLLATAQRAGAKMRGGEPVSLGERAAWLVADRVVLGRVRAKMGGRLRLAFSGGAAISRDVAEFVDGLGITVYEGYGLTETAALTSGNCPGHRRLGSAGRTWPGSRIEIDAQEGAEEQDGYKVGEIIVHGPNVMVGYHNLPVETAAAFTPDGGLRTGDLGYLDRDGYLFITGRLKEQYKLDNGKFVVPATLEEALRLSPYISNVMVYGDNRPCNVALVVVSPAAVKGWALNKGFHLDEETLHVDPRVRALVEQEIGRLSAGFRSYEVVRELEIIDRDFTVESGMMTPSLKIRRAEVVRAYRDRIDAMYARMPTFCPPPGKKTTG